MRNTPASSSKGWIPKEFWPSFRDIILFSSQNYQYCTRVDHENFYQIRDNFCDSIRCCLFINHAVRCPIWHAKLLGCARHLVFGLHCHLSATDVVVFFRCFRRPSLVDGVALCTKAAGGSAGDSLILGDQSASCRLRLASMFRRRVGRKVCGHAQSSSARMIRIGAQKGAH